MPMEVVSRRMIAPVVGSLISFATRAPQLVTHFDACPGAYVEHDLSASTAATRPLHGDSPDRDLAQVAHQIGSRACRLPLCGFSDDGVLEVAGAEVGVAAAEAMPVTAAAQHGSAGAARLALPLSHGQNLARVHVDEAGVDADVGLGVGMAYAAQAKCRPSCRPCHLDLSSWSRCRTR